MLEQISFLDSDTNVVSTPDPVPQSPQIKLRPYQKDCVRAVLDHIDNGCNRQVISLCTGGGKTIIIGSLIDKIPSPTPKAKKVLVIAHRKELVDQNAEKIGWLNPHLKIGIERGGVYADVACDVISATVQTLGHSKSGRIRKLDPEEYKAVIIDETHHAVETNSTYKYVLDHFGFNRANCKRVLLGFTATVKRADGRGLKHAFDEISFHLGIRDGIDQKFLTPIRALRIDSDTDISGVTMNSGKFVENELEEAINIEERNDLIYRSWHQYALSEGRKATLIFCANRKHLWAVVDMFRENGVDARGVDGNTPQAEREKTNSDFLNGKFPVLVGCGVYTEGSDFPNIDTLIMARPCGSAPTYIQCVGRGIRLPSGYQSTDEIDDAVARGEDVKQDCLVLDVVDVCGKHSLITTPVLFDLKQDFDAEGEQLHKIAKKMDELIAKNPSADKAKTVKEAEKIVAEEIDLMSMRDPDDEYQEMMNLQWKQSAEDTIFRADIPKDGGYFEIRPDMLGNFELTFCGKDGNKSLVQKKNDVEIAFQAAENWLESNHSDVMMLMKKDQAWHKDMVTESQKSFMKKLKVNHDNIDGLTKLEASRLIDEAIRQKKFGFKRGRRTKNQIDNVQVGKIN